MSMKYFFRDQQTISKFRLHPLGKYMHSYAKHLHSQGYYRENWPQEDPNDCTLRSVAKTAGNIREGPDREGS